MKRKYNSRYAPTLRAVAGRGPVDERKAPEVEPFSDEELARCMEELASMPLELEPLELEPLELPDLELEPLELEPLELPDLELAPVDFERLALELSPLPGLCD